MGWLGRAQWEDGPCATRMACLCERPLASETPAPGGGGGGGADGGVVFLIILNVLLLLTVGALVYKYVLRGGARPAAGVTTSMSRTQVEPTPTPSTYQAPTGAMTAPLAINDAAATASRV